MLGRPGAVTVVSYNMHSDWVKDRKPQEPREPNLYIWLPVFVWGSYNFTGWAPNL